MSKEIERTFEKALDKIPVEWGDYRDGPKLFDISLPFWIFAGSKLESLGRRKEQTLKRLEAISSRLEELIVDAEFARAKSPTSPIDTFSLHPEIVRHAGQLYRDEHYAQAVETAVKAFSNLVRLKSGSEEDGL